MDSKDFFVLLVQLLPALSGEERERGLQGGFLGMDRSTNQKRRRGAHVPFYPPPPCQPLMSCTNCFAAASITGLSLGVSERGKTEEVRGHNL